MAPRFLRTRISDYLVWSQAWVVYFIATVRYHPHLLPHLCSETFCGATPGGPWSVLFGQVSPSGSRSGTRDPSSLRGPATYCRRAPAVQLPPPQWPWRSPGDIPQAFFVCLPFRLFHCSSLGTTAVAAEALGFATDTSGVGLGAAFGLKWLYAAWPPAFRAYHVNVLELFAVAVAVHCWGEEWHDTQILLHTDNMQVVPVLPPRVACATAFLFPCPAEREFASGGVPGWQDINADMLSRLQVVGFRSRACETLPVLTMVPSHVWEWL